MSDVVAPVVPIAEPAAPPQLVEVAFKGNRREFFLWPADAALAPRTAVIVEAERGEDLGRVHATGDLAERRKAGTTHGKAAPAKLRKVVRVAGGPEIARAAQLRVDEDNVRRRAIEKVRSQGLEMKVSDTEWQWDKKRLTIYFTAEKRVDFRQLVRQLEGLFGTRVQMWHIGVRDEAKRLDGVGRCARQYCSASWLPELRPVKSSVAKDQRLSTLNPAQISGSCGRLMCCLRHEHEFYVQQRRRFPKEGKVLVTTLGEEKVVSNDIFREQVTLRAISGDVRTVALSALNRELGVELLETTVEPPSEPEEEEESEEERGPVVAIERAPARGDAARREGPRGEGPRGEGPRGAAPLRDAPRGDTPHTTDASADERPPADPAPADAGAAPPQMPREGRRRRRRGRRGGRRGQGGGGAPGSPPSGGAPGDPPSGGARSGPSSGSTPPAPPASGS
ncbi:MAG TPA: regulatory iron-sulfur-containing complex subunit RicT [Gemmatimonadaceae bacterium]|nr:regulatory iron-sulfur-containing complex subunit RicT [Gemmatimonadaceae bacterium]